MATIKTVKELYVRCMLPVRHLNGPGRAASDCCQAPATAAVIMPSGRRMWRCEQHKTYVSLTDRSGQYVREVIIKDVVPV